MICETGHRFCGRRSRECALEIVDDVRGILDDFESTESAIGVGVVDEKAGNGDERGVGGLSGFGRRRRY